MATPDNGKNIISSMNPALNYLLTNNLTNKIITVAKAGGGNYTTIAAALNAGHTYIVVKKGIYQETEDLILDGVTLIAESPGNCVIQLGSNSIELKTHSTADSYKVGTCTFALNSTTVTGAATIWDTGANAPSSYIDPWIISEGFCFPIASFESNTLLTIKTQYRGSGFSGDYIIIDAANIGSQLSNFRIEHSPTISINCLKVSGIGNIVNNNVFICDRTNTNFVINCSPDNSYNIATKIYNNNIISGAIGLDLNSAQSCEIKNNIFNSQNDHAIRINTAISDCLFNTISSNKIFGCSNTAIEVLVGADNTEISYNNISRSRASCITVDDSDYLNITNNTLEGNSSESIVLTTTCRYCTVENNQLKSEGMILSCRDTIIQSNYCNGTIEINGNENQIISNIVPSGKIVSNGNDNTVNSNHITLAIADEGLHLNGSHNTCVGNKLAGAEGYGIVCDGAGGHVVSGNNISNAANDSIRVDAPDCNINGNTIINYSSGGGYGINIITTAVRSIINSNIIRNALGSAHGIFCNSDKISISSNKITETNGGNGIHFSADAQGPNGECKISDNHIEDVAIGILCHTSDGFVSVNNNTIVTTSSDGIRKTGNGNNVNIENNQLKNISTIAISVEASNKFSVICGNAISVSGSHGILLDSSTADSYNVISNNTVSSTTGIGIYLSSGGEPGTLNNRCAISSNNIFNSSSNAITIATSDNVVSNNICFYSINGISVTIGDKNIVNANNCQFNSSYGITIASASDRIIITNSIALNNTTGQILDNGTNTVNANNIVA